MAWQYNHDPDAREWTCHYKDGSFGVVRLLSIGKNAEWLGRLVVIGGTPVSGKWKDSGAARKGVDKMQREHYADTILRR